MMSDGMMGFGMNIRMVLNQVFWLLMIAGIILLGVWAVKRGCDKGDVEGESVLEILKKRYARGEILKEEYEEKKKALFEGSSSHEKK